MKALFRIILCIIITVSVLEPAVAQERKGVFRDTIDNAFDISKWLFDLHGFLPVVSPITEPALGYGFAAVGVFFIPKEKSSPGQFKMPDLVGLGGGYTQNGTWFAGAGMPDSGRITASGTGAY